MPSNSNSNSDSDSDSKEMQPDDRVLKRHTYHARSSETKTNNNSNNSNNQQKTNNKNDLFAFSMHGSDPTLEFSEDSLPSPSQNDMYIDHDTSGGDRLVVLAESSLSTLSLDFEQDETTTDHDKNTKAKKKKKKRNSKRLSSDSQERDDIAIEREALQLKSCELESKLEEDYDDDPAAEDQQQANKRTPRSPLSINNDALLVENTILKRRLQRQDEIILEQSNRVVSDNLRRTDRQK
ncbi:unnamed protein product [Cylindrotheca closterium]|uniref:Uncharacterized protein n=1 Tax=Cylindrotheca closterium TaxID=2856 RepID=A0AAD2JM08_9STRA|nr:unnamed protein product [Cylindrotheca closterium]